MVEVLDADRTGLVEVSKVVQALEAVRARQAPFKKTARRRVPSRPQI